MSYNYEYKRDEENFDAIVEAPRDHLSPNESLNDQSDINKIEEAVIVFSNRYNKCIKFSCLTLVGIFVIFVIVVLMIYAINNINN